MKLEELCAILPSDTEIEVTNANYKAFDGKVLERVKTTVLGVMSGNVELKDRDVQMFFPHICVVMLV